MQTGERKLAKKLNQRVKKDEERQHDKKDKNVEEHCWEEATNEMENIYFTN